MVTIAEPRHEPEIAMARLQVDATLGDPGYGRHTRLEVCFFQNERSLVHQYPIWLNRLRACYCGNCVPI